MSTTTANVNDLARERSRRKRRVAHSAVLPQNLVIPGLSGSNKPGKHKPKAKSQNVSMPNARKTRKTEDIAPQPPMDISAILQSQNYNSNRSKAQPTASTQLITINDDDDDDGVTSPDDSSHDNERPIPDRQSNGDNNTDPDRDGSQFRSRMSVHRMSDNTSDITNKAPTKKRKKNNKLYTNGTRAGNIGGEPSPAPYIAAEEKQISDEELIDMTEDPEEKQAMITPIITNMNGITLAATPTQLQQPQLNPMTRQGSTPIATADAALASSSQLEVGWFYVDRKGTTKGPVSLTKLRYLYAHGLLKDSHYLWNGTTVQEWTPLKRIHNLLDEIKSVKNPGFPLSLFIGEDHDKVGKQYQCHICGRIVRNCVELDCKMGHLFCESCIENHFQTNGNYCPMCRQPDVAYHPIQFVRRIIAQMKVKCESSALGCNWIGTLDNFLRAHSTNECEYSEVVCEGCSQKLQRRFAKEHTLQCEEYPITCVQCNNVIRRKYEVTHLKEVCPFTEVMCTSKGTCLQKIMRKDLKSHLKNECCERIVKCQFYKCGCNFRGKAKDLANHTMDPGVMMRHNELQLQWMEILLHSPKYIAVSGWELVNRDDYRSAYNGCAKPSSLAVDSDNSLMVLNGIYRRETNVLHDRPFYRRRHKDILIRWHPTLQQWVFVEKSGTVLATEQTNHKYYRSNTKNPCNAIWNIQLPNNPFPNPAVAINISAAYTTPNELTVKCDTPTSQSKKVPTPRDKTQNAKKDGSDPAILNGKAQHTTDGSGAAKSTLNLTNTDKEKPESAKKAVSKAADIVADLSSTVTAGGVGGKAIGSVSLYAQVVNHALYPHNALPSSLNHASRGSSRSSGHNRDREGGSNPGAAGEKDITEASVAKVCEQRQQLMHQYFVHPYKKVNLVGFDDLLLFRRLNLLESPRIVRVSGRRGINSQINGIYFRQTTLHCGRVWYYKPPPSHYAAQKLHNAELSRYLAQNANLHKHYEDDLTSECGTMDLGSKFRLDLPHRSTGNLSSLSDDGRNNNGYNGYFDDDMDVNAQMDSPVPRPAMPRSRMMPAPPPNTRNSAGSGSGASEKRAKFDKPTPYGKLQPTDRSNDSKWVIRYHSSSEQWLFDKRGLRSDDIANAVGKGNVFNPTLIPHWDIHNGAVFISDPNISIHVVEL